MTSTPLLSTKKQSKIITLIRLLATETTYCRNLLQWKSFFPVIIKDIMLKLDLFQTWINYSPMESVENLRVRSQNEKICCLQMCSYYALCYVLGWFNWDNDAKKSKNLFLFNAAIDMKEHYLAALEKFKHLYFSLHWSSVYSI